MRSEDDGPDFNDRIEELVRRRLELEQATGDAPEFGRAFTNATALRPRAVQGIVPEITLTRAESERTMPTNTTTRDIAEMDLNHVLAGEAGMIPLARELARRASSLTRILTEMDAETDLKTLTGLNRRAHELATDVAIAMKLTSDDTDEPMTHINMISRPATLRPSHVVEDTRVLVETFLVDVNCAVSCALSDNRVGMSVDLTAIALRRDQFTQAQALINLAHEQPEKAVAYGVPVKVVQANKDNLDALKQLIAGVTGDQIKDIRVEGESVLIQMLDEDDSYVTTDVTGAYFVEVLDEISIIDEDTLKHKYVWKG